MRRMWVIRAGLRSIATQPSAVQPRSSYDGNGNLTYDGSRTYGYDLCEPSDVPPPVAARRQRRSPTIRERRLHSVSASNGVTTRLPL